MKTYRLTWSITRIIEAENERQAKLKFNHEMTFCPDGTGDDVYTQQLKCEWRDGDGKVEEING